MRFYPDSVPPYPHEPDRSRFDIRPVDDQRGVGVVSLVEFAPGDLVFRFTGFLLGEITQFSLQISPDEHIHDPFFMGKVLHHCEPNCRVEISTRSFYALKPIHPGEIVTMDYDTTEDALFKPFQCSCGAPSCRGLIQGRNPTARNPMKS